ncbi:CadC family transcriptional regulator [Pseudomonas sp. WN033]|nr:CadC family transcriptional regulator [Pseudomonas sp. WN033]
MNAPQTSSASQESITPLGQLLLRTGREGRCVCFCPSLFQVVIRQPEVPEERIELGYAGSRLLERLLKVPGEVVTREELMAYAWPDRVVGQGSLNQQIYSLRQLFCDEKGREIIQTLPRRGYQFNPQYIIQQSAVTPAPPQPPTQESEPVPEPKLPAAITRHRPRRYWLAGALLGLALIGLIFSLWPHSAQQIQAQELTLRELQHGPIQIRLFAIDHASLDALEPLASTLAQRLPQDHANPRLLTLDLHGSYYRVLCEHGGNASALMIHRGQFEQLDIGQLRWCQP